MPRPAPKPKPRRSSRSCPSTSCWAWWPWPARSCSGGRPRAAADRAATTLEQVVMTPEQLQRVPGISQGQPNAPVVIMEFADFQCPGCGRFAQLLQAADEGLHRQRHRALRVVRLSARADPPERRAGGARRPLRQRAEPVLGLSRRDLRPPDRSGRRADDAGDHVRRSTPSRRGWTAAPSASACGSEKYQKEVSESSQLGTTLGVPGTPTLFVNGKRVQETPDTRARVGQR